MAAHPKKIMAITSLVFILVSAVPSVDTRFYFLSRISGMVTELAVPSLMAASQIKTITGTIKKGETASSLLKTYIPLKEIHDINHKSKQIFPLTGIKKGQPYTISIMEDSLVEFEYEINREDRLVIQKEADSFAISKLPIEYELNQEVVSVEIKSSLYQAVQRAGESDALTWELADIFAWDIDFAKDIQPGDQFSVLVEKRYKEGKFYGYSDILAAFFINNGVEYRAFLYKDINGNKGYYNEKGQSLQKAFLKAPLNYSRISSPFSTKRLHPILKKVRAHPGVDYAAPKNTPIKTVADGTITAMGHNDSMGRYITIKHFNGYETDYFHMNQYAKGMKKNKKVSQGDVIGYVGKTGLATGYHLCFRMRNQGNPVNPLKQTMVSAKPVSKKEINRFVRLTQTYFHKIQANQKLAQTIP